ncbi:ABC transporter substrate-binding protein [Lichenicoccus sp.]|uniref:ABC transporter substrate-binding protein n=1 Tax=Lichenicoccus sp. TaxID=2781899 RepID=UPI003D1174FF
MSRNRIAAAVFAACLSLPIARASAADSSTVTVGAILPLSGLFSTLGPPERDAMQMAIEAINAGGGFKVAGKQHTLAVKVLDDESAPATVGISDYRQLVEVDHVPVLVLADNTRIYGAQFRRAPLPVLNILDSTYPSILDVNKHVFLLRSDTPAYVPGGVWYLKNVLHKQRISFIGSAADPYSKGLEIWMKKAAKQYGLDVVSDVNYPPNTTDFAPFIQTAMAAKPDAIYLGGVTQEVLPVAKQLYQSGVRGVPVLHNAGATPTQAKQIIGDPLYNDVMLDSYDFAGSLPQTSTDPATQAFFKAFLSRFKEYPDDLTMWAYDAPFVLVAAMQKAGSVTDRVAIYNAMLTMKVPPHTISGWIPTKDGKLFHDRDAQTLAEGVRWCPQAKTIGAAFLFFMQGLEVTRQQIVQNGCTGP